MRRRALGLLVLLVPALAHAGEHTVDLKTGAVRKGYSGTPTQCAARSASPAAVDFDGDHMFVLDSQTGKRVARVRLRERGGTGLSWIVQVGRVIVVGTDLRGTNRAAYATDLVFALDAATGRELWRRAHATRYSADLDAGLILVEVPGGLEVIDAPTGKTTSSFTASPQIEAVCRTGGAYVVKTSADLLALDSSGVPIWRTTTSTRSEPALLAGRVVDAWIDHQADTYGLAIYDETSGKQISRIQVGPTGGWYDIVYVRLAIAGADEVAISASFGVE